MLTQPAVFNLDGRFMARWWSADDKRVISQAKETLSDELKGNLSAYCTHVKGHGGVKKSLRLLTRVIPPETSDHSVLILLLCTLSHSALFNMMKYYFRLIFVFAVIYGCMYILFGGCQTINYILMIPIYFFFDWIFNDSDDDSSFLSNTMFMTFLVTGTLSYVWHNSDLARSLGVDCHILGEIMDTRIDMAKDIDRYIRNLDLRDL
jgi:hypothetical protein